MADCTGFPSGTPQCATIQVIEPDSTLPTTTIPSAGFDPSMTEAGNVILYNNQQTQINVTFNTVKAGDYRFEYLYVDSLGLSSPGVIPIVPVSQSVYGFSVNLAGIPLADGYILRWRVVVVTIVQAPPGQQIDAPENIYINLTLTNTFTVPFVNPRSNTQYGFSELRVENLVDLPANQHPILAQVVTKTVTNFTVALSPTPDTANYYLKVRTP